MNHLASGFLCLYQVFSSDIVVGSSRPMVSGNNNKDKVTITFMTANTTAGPHGIYSVWKCTSCVFINIWKSWNMLKITIYTSKDRTSVNVNITINCQCGIINMILSTIQSIRLSWHEYCDVVVVMTHIQWRRGCHHIHTVTLWMSWHTDCDVVVILTYRLWRRGCHDIHTVTSGLSWHTYCYVVDVKTCILWRPGCHDIHTVTSWLLWHTYCYV